MAPGGIMRADVVASESVEAKAKRMLRKQEKK